MTTPPQDLRPQDPSPAPVATLLRLSGRKGARGPSLVFFPDMGGNVLYARNLIAAMGPGFQAHGLRLPDRPLADLARGSLQDLAAQFARDLVASGLGPLHLVGFSFAGYLAAETARQLDRLGHPPAHLWIIDLPASPARTPVAFWRALKSRLSSRRAMILHSPGFLRVDLSAHPEGYQSIIRTLYRLFVRHRPGPWRGAATVVRALAAPRRLGPDLGWDRLISPPVACLAVPGDHLSMVNDPAHAAVLARAFVEALTDQGGDAAAAS